MSVEGRPKRITVPQITAMKGGTPVVCLTAYTSLTAVLLDDYVDLLLVGDSLGMVLYGMESTLGVTLEMMIAHGQAVMRGSKKACVIVDLPFGSYQEFEGERLPQRRAGDEGGRLLRRQAGRRHRDGGDHPLSRRARHPGARPCRPAAAVGQHRRRLPLARARREGGRGDHRGRQGGRRGRRLRHGDRRHGRAARPPNHQPRSRSRPSASARRPPATGRFW